MTAKKYACHASASQPTKKRERQVNGQCRLQSQEGRNPCPVTNEARPLETSSQRFRKGTNSARDRSRAFRGWVVGETSLSTLPQLRNQAVSSRFASLTPHRQMDSRRLWATAVLKHEGLLASPQVGPCPEHDSPSPVVNDAKCSQGRQTAWQTRVSSKLGRCPAFPTTHPKCNGQAMVPVGVLGRARRLSPIEILIRHHHA